MDDKGQLSYTKTEFDQQRDENKELKELIEKIRAISCGENQVAENDSEGMGVIYNLIVGGNNYE